MSGVILIKGKILIDTSDIQEIRSLEYQGKPDEDLTGKFIVRVFLSCATSKSKTHFIDIVCDTLSDAQRLYKNILKSRHIIDINKMRF